MAKRVHKLKDISVNNSDMTLELGMKRINHNLNKAQFALDTTVMNSMEPYMPMETGDFIQKTRAKSMSLAGSGQVCAAMSPEGRFLYEGKIMVDEKTGSPWARKGAKKVLVSEYTGKTKKKENLEFSKKAHPKAQSHWFEAAEKQYADVWKWVVEKEMKKT